MCAAVAGVAALGATAGAAQAAPTCPHTTLAQDIQQAHVIFRGVVTKAHPAHGSGVDRVRTYKVRADRVFKSSLITRSVVVTASARKHGCTLPELKTGSRYIFFANPRGPRLMLTTATAPASHHLTTQVMSRLGNGIQPQPQPPAAATFTKVAGADPPSLSRLLAPGAALVILSVLGLMVVGRSARRA
jgi:hypothetical protein